MLLLRNSAQNINNPANITCKHDLALRVSFQLFIQQFKPAGAMGNEVILAMLVKEHRIRIV